jgi:hypothetical protein
MRFFMKITDTMLSIPPYISTSWEEVSSLHMQGADLIISLKDATSVLVPHLEPTDVEKIFAAHTAFLEKQTKSGRQQEKASIEQIFTLPLSGGLESLTKMGEMLQHNPSYSGLPPLPEDAWKKIAALAKMIPEEDILTMPPPESNCMCMYCQIVRVLRKHVGLDDSTIPDHPALEEEEKISEEDLHFEQWKVEFLKDKMYRVTNKLDPSEQYTVFLGEPIGCTCGRPNCEHIVAALRS